MGRRQRDSSGPGVDRRGQGLAYGLAALLTTTGTAHFFAPRAFRRMIPARLGPPGPWVYGSGLVELACAAAVAAPRTRRVGGYAAAALFIAVFPGNVQMALDSGDRSAAYRAVVLARLPAQVPLVAWGFVVARRAPTSRPLTRRRRPR